MLGLVGDVDGRDDVIPRAKPKTAGAAFLRIALGLDRLRAGREAATARLVTGQHPDLAAVGAAYAAGQISRGHLDVATSVHRRLGTVRETPMPVTDESTGEVAEKRAIAVVHTALAGYALSFSVPELARIGDRIIEQLNPPTPDRAHARRYLHLSPLPDGSLSGTFFCGPAQALKLTSIIAALAGPRPGKAIDADGISIDLPDERTAPQRRIDALLDAIDHHPCTHRPTATDRGTGTGTGTGTGDTNGADSTDRADRADGSDDGCGVTDSTADKNASSNGHSDDGDPGGTSKSSSRQEAPRENPDDDLAQPESPPDHLAQS